MRRTEDVPIMEPVGREDRIESDVAGAGGFVLMFEVAVVDPGLVPILVSDAVNDFRRTSASRGSSRGKMAPIVRLGGNCVGMSALSSL